MQPYTVVSPTNDQVVMLVDGNGNIIATGTLTMLGGINTPAQTITGNQTVTGNQAVGGNLTVTGTTLLTGQVNTADGLLVARNLTVGSSTTLGDNGVGVLELAVAATPPTVSPVGGLVEFVDTSSTPLKIYTSDGNKHSVIDAFVFAAADQSTSTVNTPTSSTALTVAVESGAKYLIEAQVILNTTIAVNGLSSWTGPAGATMTWNDTDNPADYASTISASNSLLGTGADKLRTLRGFLQTAGAGGSLTYTFTNSAAGTTIQRANSWLRLTRMG